MTAKKPMSPSVWTAPDDAPELSEAFFQAADVYQGARLRSRGQGPAAVLRETSARPSPTVLHSRAARKLIQIAIKK